MPDLKTTRGTILYATITYDAPSGAGQSIVVPVFTMAIGGMKATSFLIEHGGDQPFGNFIPDLNDATATTFALSISKPDGTFLVTQPIAFGGVVTVAWSEAIITAFGPPTDPDWRNNPHYITMNQQFALTPHAA